MKINLKHPLLIIVLFLGVLFHSNCQSKDPEDKEDRSDRLQAAKVAYITNKLNLTSTQAQQFWPVYNEFELARKKIRKQIRKLRVDNMLLNGTEEEIKTDIKKLFALRQEELDLEKMYAEKFLTSISAKQLAEYYRSEKEFTKLLIKKLKERGGRDLKDE
jgi:hypothetical protein